jgi:hypothetical protein
MATAPCMTPDLMAAEITAQLDGPHADADTAAVAWLASEAVRFLNYATGSHAAAGLTLPGTAYTVAGELAAAVSRLGQLTGQLADFLERELAAGRLGHDHGSDPALSVQDARGHLLAAAAAAAVLEAALSGAQSDIAYLHYREGATS